MTPLRRNFDAALRDLGSKKPEVRASAAHDLGLVGDEDSRTASDALAPLVDDTYSAVRSAALTALGTLRARHLADRIASRLDDGDSNVRQMAVVALAEVGGDRALEHLREGLASDYADVRYQSMLGVLSLDAREGFAVALGALASDDPWIVSEAAEQLGRLFARDPAHRTESALGDAERARALDALRAKAGDAHDRVAVSASIALVRMGEMEAAPTLCAFVLKQRAVEGEDRDALAVEALELLGAVEGDAAGAAREALAAVAWRVIPSPERAVARASLARLGDPRACEELVEQLRSLLPGRREAAVKLVRIARMRSAEGALLGLLEDRSVEPAFVLDALSVVGGERSRTALARLARNDPSADVRDAARRALAQIEEPPR